MSTRLRVLPLLLATFAAQAQHAGHDMSHAGHDMGAMQREASTSPPDAPPADPHAGHDMQGTDHSMHAAQSAVPETSPTRATPPADAHAGHDMQGMDHSMHAMPPATPDAPRTPIPAVTDADRAAAFAPLNGHPMHDRGTHAYLRVDRLEVDDGDGLAGEVTAWIGGDVHRGWLRAEGRRDDGGPGHASVELLYGRLVAPWWEVVAGVRHDTGDGPSRNWAALGVQGVAPYKIELRATAYLGTGGDTAARVEAEYDTLLTRRWVLQWRTEASAYGRDDPARGIGSGLSTWDAGARLRYEITRGFAPYVGVEYERAYGGTASARRAHGEDDRDTRVVAGLRLIF